MRPHNPKCVFILPLIETATGREVSGADLTGKLQRWSFANHSLQRKNAGIRLQAVSVVRNAIDHSALRTT
jgi:hypothetical protein